MDASDLQKQLLGHVLQPYDAAYQQVLKRAFSTVVCENSHPKLIVGARCSGDVAHVIAFCKTHKLGLSVVGGAQNPSGAGLSGDVVLDMADMRGVFVDEKRETAAIGAGCLWSEVEYALAAYRKCIPGPIWSSVSAAGVTLGGGFGFLSKKYGMTCDAVLSMEVVTSESQILHVDAKSHHRDLFWALTRGGGAGTLCVVTRLTYKLEDAPSAAVWHGRLEWPLEQCGLVVKCVRQHKSTWPETLVCYPYFHQSSICLLVFSCAEIDVPRLQVERFLAPFRAIAHCSDFVAEKSYLDVQTKSSFFSRGRCFQKARFISDATDVIAQLVCERWKKLDESIRNQSKVLFQNYFNDTGYLLVASMTCSSREEEGPMKAWTLDLIENVAKIDDSDLGGAPNFAPLGTDLNELFGEDEKRRILAVKHKYDGDNFFSFNVLNFKPFMKKKNKDEEEDDE